MVDWSRLEIAKESEAASWWIRNFRIALNAGWLKTLTVISWVTDGSIFNLLILHQPALQKMQNILSKNTVSIACRITTKRSNLVPSNIIESPQPASAYSFGHLPNRRSFSYSCHYHILRKTHDICINSILFISYLHYIIYITLGLI